jgi:hypothetical protein
MSWRDTSRIIAQSLHTKKPRQQARNWDELYETLVAYKEQHGDCEVPARYSDSGLPWWIARQRRERDKLTLDQRERLEALGFDLATVSERQEKEWKKNYERLVDFKQLYGHCNVPQTSLFDEELKQWADELGSWVSEQRKKYRRSKLTDERQSMLKSINFEWSLKPHKKVHDSTKVDEKWHFRYLDLVEFHKVHGHCLVPYSTYDEECKNLGIWVLYQRQRFAENRLPSDRKELLDDLGFVWKIDIHDADASTNQQEWDRQFEKLMQFKADHRNSDVPRTFTRWGLGLWLQRQKYLERKGRLDDQRKQRLASVGVTWSIDLDQRWAESYGKLRAFKRKHGHCCPRSKTDELYSWVRDQRYRQKKGKLLPERKAKLEDISFSWEVTLGRAKRKRSETCDLDSADEDFNRQKKRTARLATARLASDKQLSQDIRIGRRIAVYWSDDDEYYEGTVTQQRERGSFFVEYDDGDQEWVDAETKVKILNGTASKRQHERNALVSRVRIGSRVSVWWPAENKNYIATVTKIKVGKSKPHYLEYEDGDVEWTNLLHRDFNFLYPTIH